jgi:hypothetical protein
LFVINENSPGGPNQDLRRTVRPPWEISIGREIIAPQAPVAWGGLTAGRRWVRRKLVTRGDLASIVAVNGFPLRNLSGCANLAGWLVCRWQ